MTAISSFFDGMHGVIFPFGGTVAPAGFLLCDGKAYSRTAYAALFAVIGTNFGAGDGSTTFNVPDLRGRVAAGKDNMGGTAAGRLTGSSSIAGTTLGAVGGTEVHTLTEAQMPNHTHTAHINRAPEPGSIGGGNAFRADSYASVTSEPFSSFGGSIDNVGSSQPHPNVQPTMILNYIIKA